MRDARCESLSRRAGTTSFHGICSGNREIFGEVNGRMERVKSRMKGFRVPVFRPSSTSEVGRVQITVPESREK